MSARPSSTATGPTRRHARHAALLTGVSVMALFLANAAVMARPLGGQAPTPSAAAMAASQSAAQEAAAVAQQSQDALARATRAIQAMQAVQDAARLAAQAS
ncbi:hypothetical protein, partial [Bradyrhizobium sp. Leo170]|uniref:hypothetical protein n=1 Tax=Bradyrhizobium sp. Leo170 TaxID=1571199 RepID=UPI0010CE94AF